MLKYSNIFELIDFLFLFFFNNRIHLRSPDNSTCLGRAG